MAHVIKVFRVKLPQEKVEKFEQLIKDGEYVTYADALRHAIDLLLKKHKK